MACTIPPFQARAAPCGESSSCRCERRLARAARRDTSVEEHLRPAALWEAVRACACASRSDRSLPRPPRCRAGSDGSQATGFAHKALAMIPRRHARVRGPAKCICASRLEHASEPSTGISVTRAGSQRCSARLRRSFEAAEEKRQSLRLATVIAVVQTAATSSCQNRGRLELPAGCSFQFEQSRLHSLRSLRWARVGLKGASHSLDGGVHEASSGKPLRACFAASTYAA